MIPINFLAASKLQAAIESLPRTCADDHGDRYSAWNGEIEMSQHDTDLAFLIVQLIEAHRLGNPAVDIALTLASVDAYFFVDVENHVDGLAYGEELQKQMQGAGK